MIVMLLFFCGSCKSEQTTGSKDRPNIVLIVADDLGFSDLGCFGSEIATPNIDALARQGQILTNFYTAATCSPTRAMLLSGTDNHIAGLGNMAERVTQINEQVGKPGYEGYLNDRVVSVAQLLKDQGYHTYISGKWHLGLTPDQSPRAKGFERSYTLLDAYTNHFIPYPENRFWEDDHYTDYPDGQYSTNFYTDKLIQFIEKDHDDNQPFFLYAAYTSPHWPLQAPKEHIEKYRGVYDIGYDSLRSRRFQGLKEKGIIPNKAKLPILPDQKGALYNITDEPLLPWESLNKEQQRIEAHKMEIYAGMVDNLDYNIGRLIEYLKQIDEYDNTYFVFFSDNGAAVLDANMTPDGLDQYDAMGTANSFVGYGPPWAHASSAGYRLYKGYATEGGIHTPLIIKMPQQQLGRGHLGAFTTVMDMAPTFLEISGGAYPSSYQGHPLTPYRGSSLLPLLRNEQANVHNEDYIMGWELFGRCALRQENWKITKVEAPFGKGRFELFNLEEDPTELNDLALEYPDKYQELLSEWELYVQDVGVILLNK
jgi:arylsulfatase